MTVDVFRHHCFVQQWRLKICLPTTSGYWHLHKREVLLSCLFSGSSEKSEQVQKNSFHIYCITLLLPKKYCYRTPNRSNYKTFNWMGSLIGQKLYEHKNYNYEQNLINSKIFNMNCICTCETHNAWQMYTVTITYMYEKLTVQCNCILWSWKWYKKFIISLLGVI